MNRIPYQSLLATCLLSAVVFGGERHTVRLENPFSRSHRLQPVSSVLDVPRAFLPRGEEPSPESLDRDVAPREEASGQLICMQWSDLRSGGNGGGVQATANYLASPPARTTRTLKLAGPVTTERTGAAAISVRHLPAEKAMEVRSGRLGPRLGCFRGQVQLRCV